MVMICILKGRGLAPVTSNTHFPLEGPLSMNSPAVHQHIYGGMFRQAGEYMLHMFPASCLCYA